MLSTSATRVPPLLTAADVAARLGVKRDTVYAYVSRGLLSRRHESGAAGSLYDPAEVEALSRRSRKAAPSQAVTPAFRSALTTIAHGALYYRGLPVCSLALERRFEDVVRLLWHGALDRGSEPIFPRVRSERTLAAIGRRLDKHVLPLERLSCLVPFLAARDSMRHDTSRRQVARKAAGLMVSLLCAMEQGSAPLDDSHAALIWSRLSPRPATPGLLAALDAALMLAADHDLGAPSTAAVRLAAAVRSDIYSVVSVGLNSGGADQSASAAAIESDLSELEVHHDAGRLLGDRLRQGREMQGFGHPAYPEGDPRARLVLDMLRRSGEADREVAALDEIIGLQRQRGREPPNIGFAIAAVAHCAHMQRGSAELVFICARMAGWVAHAMEEYDAPQTLPRFKSIYVGPQPARSGR
jgi:citrate synthase